MVDTVELANLDVFKDLHTYIARLAAAGADRVWLRTSQRAAARYLRVGSGMLAPDTLLEATPTIIAERSFLLNSADASIRSVQLNGVFALPAIAERIARMETTKSLVFAVPPTQQNAVWAAVAPPASGWQSVGSVSASSVNSVARQLAQQVQQALPDSPGAALLAKVRRELWSPQVLPQVPAGAALTCDALGFCADPLQLLQNGNWSALASAAGTVYSRLP